MSSTHLKDRGMHPNLKGVLFSKETTEKIEIIIETKTTEITIMTIDNTIDAQIRGDPLKEETIMREWI